MIYAAVTFKFDGKSWRCIDFFPMQASFMLGDVDKEMKAWPAIKTVYMRRMFGKALNGSNSMIPIDVRIMNTYGKTTAELQREAQSVGLILKTNGRRTVMANRKLNGFAPIRTCYKTEPLEAA